MVLPTTSRNHQPINELITDQASDQMGKFEAVTVALFENNVPSFVAAEMDQLYGSLYSSLTKYRIYGDLEGVSTYVVREDGKAITIFLFRRNKGKVQVMNEVIKIDQEEIRQFAETIFSSFKSISVIAFNAIQTNINRLPFPYQRINCLEDLVLKLPSTSQEYLANLGQSTRRTIKNNLSKIKQRFPSFCYAAYVDSEVSEQYILDIIQLNRIRMARKNKISGIDNQEAQRIINLVRACGSVSVVTIDGRVCAGMICCRVNANYFMHVIAHDPEYDNYKLGTLCCFLTISDCIVRGGYEFHFLWGRYSYKYRFLAIQRDLDHIAIYRSRIQFLRNGDVALKIVLSACGRQMMLWLHETKGRNIVIARLITSIANVGRALRGFKKNLLTRG